MEEGGAIPEISICIVGNARVGKTAVVRTFCQSEFSEEYISTVGSDFETRLFDVDGQIVKLHLQHLSGQEAFLWQSKPHIQKADGFVYCYDVTDHVTFEGIPRWFELINKHAKQPNLPKILLGNKLDLRHKQEVTSLEAKEYGIPNGMKQVEASAKSGQNIAAAFYVLASDVLRFRRLGGFIPIGVTHNRHGVDLMNIHESTSSVSECSENSADYVNVFRILMLGDVRVGKSAIRLRFCRDHYNPEYYASSGLEYSTRTLLVDGDKVKVQIWDISGDDVYETLRKSYYKGANAFAVVYDVTNRNSFEKAEHLVKDLDMYEKSDCPKIVIGNKCEKRGVVTSREAMEWGSGWRVPVAEVSAKTGSNVDAAFYKLVGALKQHLAPWKKVYDFS